MIYEKNIISKNVKKTNIRIALSYPNIYRTAMSSLGYNILYNIINIPEDIFCERVIYPNNRSIETNTPLKDFNIICFSLQYEEDYFNLLKMLQTADIPLKREDRDKNDPLIIAGGPCVSSNPKPLHDFIDLFVIGEGEVIINDLFNCYRENKKDLKKYLEIPGIYIPQFNNKTQIVLVDNLDDIYHITEHIITEVEDKEYTPIFNKTIMLNVSRGCTRGCRFCMSGYLYRPIRETSLEKLFEIAEESRLKTGLNRITLIGAAVSDYTKINELTKGLLERGFEMSTPSLRIESITKEYLETLKKSGLKTITIAPESIPKLRNRVNKFIPDEKIFNVIKEAINLGFNIKFYFLIGIPNETHEDIKELAKYIKKIASIKNKSMKFSINPVIPKANTPLQWNKYDFKDIKKKMRYLKKELKEVNVKYESPKKGLIQYILSCSDKTLGDVLVKSLNKPITLKEWQEHIPNYEPYDKVPWSNIDVGISNTFLKLEYKRIKMEKETQWCKEGPCSNCGSCEN